MGASGLDSVSAVWIFSSGNRYTKSVLNYQDPGFKWGRVLNSMGHDGTTTLAVSSG